MTTRITRSSGDAFLDLGFTPGDAEKARLRSELMLQLAAMIEDRGLTQAEAAVLFGVHQPRISDLVRGQLHLFSLDTLVEMLGKAGMTVSVVVEPAEWRAPEVVEIDIGVAEFATAAQVWPGYVCVEGAAQGPRLSSANAALTAAA